MDIANIIGYTGTICLLFGYLPQTIRTIRTRSTDDIAMGTFLLMGIASVLFCVNGIMTGNYPVAIANGLTGVMSAIIFGIKVENDLKKSKKVDK